MSRDEIRQKLRIVTISLTTSAANVFANVPERTMRNVVAIWLTGDGTSRTVTIAWAGERTGNIFPDIPVPPAGFVQIPEGQYDIENPVIVVEGGTRITAAQNAGSGVDLVCVYWDDVEK